MAASQPFETPGQCKMADCEVTLKFDEDESPLYVCKHPLFNLGEYFERLFSGKEWKENIENKIQIEKDVTRSEMLLFLRFAVPIDKFKAHKPSNIAELCTLIKLAHRFLCTKLFRDIVTNLPKLAPSWSPRANELSQLFSLGDRLLTCDLNQAIAEHILSTKKNYEQTSQFKLAIVEAAYKHRESSTVILETCIRLCANLELHEVAQLRGKGMDGVVFAIYDTIGKVTPNISDPARHLYHGGKECEISRNKGKYDGLAFTRTNNVKHWFWYCTTCEGVATRPCEGYNPTIPFEKVMQIQIEKSLLQ